MARVWWVLVATVAACSFDEDGATPPDAPVAAADCGMPLFPGFDDPDAGPFDCTACGCMLDDFSEPTLSTVRWKQTDTGGWQTEVAGGAVLLATPTANSGGYDSIFSNERFFMAGDFDVLLDWDVSAWTPGWSLLLYAFGPLVDANTREPTLMAGVYDDGAVKMVLALETDRFDVPVSVMRGTLELRRAGGQLCAELRGVYSLCRTVDAGAPVFLDYLAVCSQTPCSAFAAHFTQPRLSTGRLVAHP